LQLLELISKKREKRFMKDELSKHTDDIAKLPSRLAGEDYCYLTTTGRVSGHPHEIEIWFAIEEDTLYLLSGGGEGSDWVKNLRVNPAVTVRIGKHIFTGLAWIVGDKEENTLARHLLAAKYQGWREGRPLSDWAHTALAVALEIIHSQVR
jgi:deazaflavin-dependent oxidoreductase (nitroreductase family)